ncbi:hypothetical protein AB0D58_34985 [Streptomyces sp. NPDC048210]|uniref:hypothetical protein n=1 Tax=unclassified Streptomyces TaxID=2593676 RepID=UPI002E78DF6E|nr:hypothetical protein [Streptomyces sp. JV181]MEE1774843.1 hypothetical protein [Streptomyces sp. JV181]
MAGLDHAGTVSARPEADGLPAVEKPFEITLPDFADTARPYGLKSSQARLGVDRSVVGGEVDDVQQMPDQRAVVKLDVLVVGEGV